MRPCSIGLRSSVGAAAKVVLAVPIVIHSADAEVPPYETTGYVPFADAQLAVTNYATWDEAERQWKDGVHWQITLRRAGYSLGKQTWNSIEEAMAALMRCDPTFGAWAVVQRGIDDAAMTACRMMVRMATEAPNGTA